VAHGQAGITPEMLKSAADQAKAAGKVVQDGATARMERAKAFAREAYVMSLHSMSICNIQVRQRGHTTALPICLLRVTLLPFAAAGPLLAHCLPTEWPDAVHS
jgi:hypothetical protein